MSDPIRASIALLLLLVAPSTQAQVPRPDSAGEAKIAGIIVGQRQQEGILTRTSDDDRLRYTTAQIDKMTRDPAPASRQSPVSGRKSPGVAFLLSFLVPGAGQGYNGQWGKAGVMFGGFVVSSAVLLSGFCTDSCSDNPSRDRSFVVGALGFVGFPVWSWIDAPRSASRINERLSRGALDRRPQVQLTVGRIRF